MRASLIVITVAFVFLGGLFVAIGGRPLFEDWRYRRATTMHGVATATALREATDASSTEYEISYRAVVDGQAHDRTEIVPVHVWELAQAGTPVPIEYLPGRPEMIRVAFDDADAALRSVVFTAIGALLLLGGLAAANRAMRWRQSGDERQPAAAAAIPAHEASYWPRARQSPDFWLGTIFMVVASPLVIATLAQVVEEWRFARAGVSTDGMVLTKKIKGTGRGNQSRRTYEATYRVTVPEGAFENRAAVPRDTWSRLRERQTVEVVYLPEQPAKNRLKVSRPWMGASFLGLIGFVLFGVGATFFKRSVRQARLEWRLLRHGAAATATVVEVRDRHLKINGVRQWRLIFEYTDFQARRHSGTHDVPEDEAQQWQAGDQGAVRYDPGHAADVIWLGRPS